jgi:hypothetical protein
MCTVAHACFMLKLAYWNVSIHTGLRGLRALTNASLHTDSCITLTLGYTMRYSHKLLMTLSVLTAIVFIRSHVCGDLHLVTLIGDRLRSFIPESSVTAATSSQQHSMLSDSSISYSNTVNTSAAQHTASTTSVHGTVCSGSGIQRCVNNPFQHTAVLAGLAMSVLAVAIDGDSECQQALLQRYLRTITLKYYTA